MLNLHKYLYDKHLIFKCDKKLWELLPYLEILRGEIETELTTAEQEINVLALEFDDWFFNEGFEKPITESFESSILYTIFKYDYDEY